MDGLVLFFWPSRAICSGMVFLGTKGWLLRSRSGIRSTRVAGAESSGWRISSTEEGHWVNSLACCCCGGVVEDVPSPLCCDG